MSSSSSTTGTGGGGGSVFCRVIDACGCILELPDPDEKISASSGTIFMLMAGVDDKLEPLEVCTGFGAGKSALDVCVVEVHPYGSIEYILIHLTTPLFAPGRA
jgi:hypothetical protein